jgi:nucleoside-diphosphate-sugar epimerase
MAHVSDRTSAARQEFERVNVIGVQVVAEEAVRAGVLRLVGISSIAAVAHASATPLTENAIPAPRSAYGRSKLAGEAALGAATAGTRTAFTVLRPPLVYGPGMRGNPLRLFELVRRGVPLPVGGQTNRRSVLYVGNLAAAILRVLEHDQAANQIFHVADDAVVSTAEFANQVGEALGRPARLWRLPGPLLRGLGWIGDATGRVLPELLPISSTQIDGLLESLELDTSRLRQRCGFVPPFSLRTALQATAAWFAASRDAAGGGRCLGGI